MANTLIKTKLAEGSKRAIFHFYLEGDGSGEFLDYVLLDPQEDFELPFGKTATLSITKVWWGSAVYDSVLKFNALVPLPVWVISAESGPEVSFEYFGGLNDYSTLESDGKILISTNGFAVAGTLGSMILEVKKD